MAETFNYAEMQAVADELVEFFGRDIQLRRKRSTPADPAKPWEGSAPDTSNVIDTKGAFVDFTATDRAGSPSIQQKDKQLVFGVQSAEIDTEWEVVDTGKNGQVWKIVEVLEQVEPGPVTVLYTCQVRI